MYSRVPHTGNPPDYVDRNTLGRIQPANILESKWPCCVRAYFSRVDGMSYWRHSYTLSSCWLPKFLRREQTTYYMHRVL